jgi:hypothetical protein
MQLTSARADIAHIHGIGRRWRNWLEFRRIIESFAKPQTMTISVFAKNPLDIRNCVI